MRRVPREVIREDAPESATYSAADAQRFESKGRNTLAKIGLNGVGRSFDFVDVKMKATASDSAVCNFYIEV